MAGPDFRLLWTNYPRGSPDSVLRGIAWGDLIGTVSERGLFGYRWSRSLRYSYGTHGYMDRSEAIWFWEMPR
jgi:hypothetical protein